MRLLRLFIALVVVAAIIAGLAWYVLRPVSVSLVIPTRGDAAEIVYASGVVEPRRWAKVTPVVRERIVQQCDCEGSRVDKGDVLARLDASEAEAALAELEARVSLAQAESRRLAVLTERNAASQQELERARSQVNQLEALVAGQKARLESYVLRAPVAGVVLRQDGEVGEVADLGTVLFWVGDATPLLIVADVNEEDIPRVEPGQRTLLRSDAFPNREMEAAVDSITPKGDPVLKTYRVRLRLPADTPLMIGMSADVNIVTRVSRDALLIPSVAVDGDRVFTVEREVAHLRRIGTGIRGTNGVEVLSGLDEDARVVSPYPRELADGARVRIVPAEE